jgi:3-oxoacyl-[acyl-carrier protein] reductase
LDVSQISSFETVADFVKSFGRLDVLVNCAGVCSGTSLDEITEQEWDRTYAINVKGPFFLTKQLLPYLIKGIDPTIINISSMAGFTGGIMSNPAYSSSKAAVTCMTKNLAKFCAPYGIRVNEISPGTAKTPMTENWLGEDGLKDFIPKVPLGRLAEAGDVAKVIEFLASDAAGFITGQTIHVNGGMYIP